MKDARNLRKRREAAGYPALLFASLVGCSLSALRSWEACRRSPSQMARNSIEHEFACKLGPHERLTGVPRTYRIQGS
jgi:transcriptional regulator with XRE-family HTH domain